MGSVVALIQKNGSALFGLRMYPVQFVSAIAFAVTALLVVYVRFAMVGEAVEK